MKKRGCYLLNGSALPERYPSLGNTYLKQEDIENGLIEARKFIIMMFPSEKLKREL